ncbi:MAG TPA: hypothetical protein VN065_08660 [Bradyrhizobium sp.]|jgi:hypothetical protein|nr:hypothetical protein [Bradyrhizobium sp.]
MIAAVRTRGDATYFGSGAFIARLLSFGRSPAQDLASQIEHGGPGIAGRIADPTRAAAAQQKLSPLLEDAPTGNVIIISRL